jgi:uncharacterized protein YndB with AHSA1/START domain
MATVHESVTIGIPRADLHAYLSDAANLSEFCDHFLSDWHLTREDSVGRGAGVRFRLRRATARFAWADLTYTDVEPPYRIVAQGRGGKNQRLSIWCEVALHTSSERLTRVEVTLDVDSDSPFGRMTLGFGTTGWLKRKVRRALRRLRGILEENEDRGKRLTLAGG